MKRTLFFVFTILAVLFSSCNQGGYEEDSAVWVVDSAWNVIATFGGASRAAEGMHEAESLVSAYNAVHTEDQYILITDEELLDIEKAPDARIMVVYADNYEVYCDNTVPREKLEYERKIAKSEARRIKYNSKRGAILFVDNESPVYVEPYEPVISRYEKYTFYVLDEEGEIVYEEHITDYYNDDDQACNNRLNMMISHWKSGAPDNWVTFIYGYIYTGPAPEPSEED
jgi:hypothetical protein